jgi:hypothetical protein
MGCCLAIEYDASSDTPGGDGAQAIHRADLEVWLGASAGAVGWLLHLVLSFVLTPQARAAHSMLPLHLVGVGALLVTLVGTLMCLHAMRRARRTAAARGDQPDDDPNAERGTRDHVVALWGFLLNLFFALVIVAQSLPTFLLHLSD